MGGSSNYMSGAGSAREPSSSQPLMIELQNGRYVRVQNDANNSQSLPLNMSATNRGSQKAGSQNLISRNLLPAQSATNPSNSVPAIASAAPPRDLPPVLLVFRDGRTEEVRDYTIADGMLYARGDFYTDGYWNKKIELSTLDLRQTLQANAARNVKFILPSSPNEVITRP